MPSLARVRTVHQCPAHLGANLANSDKFNILFGSLLELIGMQHVPQLPRNSALFLSACTQAGKTTLLRQWRAQQAPDALLLALTPEDLEPSFFLLRVFAAIPGVQAHFEGLRSQSPASPEGALLGLAIAALAPDFCLFVDDFHLAEGHPLHSFLLSLFRHFPSTGTLVIASRHQPPLGITCWGPDHPCWRPRPQLEDARCLPAPLLARALALHLIKEGEADPLASELIRRNVAEVRPDGLVRTAPCWDAAFEQVLTHAPADACWQDLGAQLLSHARRQHRTAKSLAIPALLERLPPAPRRQDPALLLLEGELLLEAKDYHQASDRFARAQAADHADAFRLDLELRLLECGVRLRDRERSEELLEALRAAATAGTPEQQAHFQYLLGISHYNCGESTESLAAWERVLTIPALGDRGVAFRHYQTLQTLHSRALDILDLPRARELVGRLATLATQHGFQRELLDAYSLSLVTSLTIETHEPPSDEFHRIPNEAFLCPSSTVHHAYLYHLGCRFNWLGDHALALRYWAFFKRRVKEHGLAWQEQLADYFLMHTHGRAGQLDEAERLYGELRTRVASYKLKSTMELSWIAALIEAGDVTRAEQALERHRAQFTEDLESTLGLLHALWLAHRQGETDALDRIEALLATPDGLRVAQCEGILLDRIGVRPTPRRLHVQAFGELGVGLARGARTAHWPRRKALSLLALLVLHPDGLGSERLSQELFGDEAPLDPQDLLHTVVYGLRKVLKSLDAETLLQSIRGSYRLDRKQVAFCDLHEFDAFYAKAEGLASDGMERAAADFYEIALLMMSGPLFDNVPDAFEEERGRYEAKRQHARAFLQRFPGRHL